MSIMCFVSHFLSLVAFAGVSCQNKILEAGDARIQINVCHVLRPVITPAHRYLARTKTLKQT